MDEQASYRLLIFIVAYRAENTLERVLERIPPAVFEGYQCEVLVVDDASVDQTFGIGQAWGAAHPERRVTVLRNEYNQGYGGNQKVGYSYAIKEGFDFVAMIHGDGQYAPEDLPRLVEPLRRGEADAVLGSRMMEAGEARKGGMPLYKYVGNRILTTLQNVLLATKLSEFHSGYRVYRVDALSRIPFHLNTNDFHFDTEVIIQLLNAGLRIVEVPIPTYYGDEICHVNGLAYARSVMHVTLQNVAHRAGLLYQRRFDVVPLGDRHYSLKLGYPSSHSWAIDNVPPGATLLSIGAGPEGLAREFIAKGCSVAIVDYVPPGELPPGARFIEMDLDGPLEFDTSPYSYVLMLDVIEHLKSPELFLERLRKHFTHDAKTLIITTPNVAFLPVRLMLLIGQFNYGREGVLDLTHTRLFTFRSLLRLLRDQGFRTRTVRGVPAPFPKALGAGWLSRFALRANLALIWLSKTLFAYQIYVEAESTPDVEFLLAHATRSQGSR